MDSILEEINLNVMVLNALFEKNIFPPNSRQFTLLWLCSVIELQSLLAKNSPVLYL